jgi:hypothetical protein
MRNNTPVEPDHELLVKHHLASHHYEPNIAPSDGKHPFGSCPTRQNRIALAGIAVIGLRRGSER